MLSGTSAQSQFSFLFLQSYIEVQGEGDFYELAVQSQEEEERRHSTEPNLDKFQLFISDEEIHSTKTDSLRKDDCGLTSVEKTCSSPADSKKLIHKLKVTDSQELRKQNPDSKPKTSFAFDTKNSGPSSVDSLKAEHCAVPGSGHVTTFEESLPMIQPPPHAQTEDSCGQWRPILA